MRNILMDFLKIIFPGKEDWTNWQIGLIIGGLLVGVILIGISKS